MADPQTGRFWQTDPLADKYLYNSTYAFSENKVTGHLELEGLEAVDANSKNAQAAILYSQDPNTKEIRLRHTFQGYDRITHFQPNGEGKTRYFFSKTPGVSMLEGLADGEYAVNNYFSFEVAKRDKIAGNFADISINGAGNTFRHLLLSSVLTGTFGENMAKRIGDMKERSDMDGEALTLDQKVDLMNNSYGRKYALDNKLVMSQIAASEDNAAFFLNSLASYTLSSIPEYSNNPDYKSIIEGKAKLFSAGSQQVKNFILILNRLINENQNYVTPENKKQ